MRTLILVLLVASTFVWGLALGDKMHANDYSTGWHSGYTAAQVDARNLPEAAVTKNMLCHYAELACRK